MSHNYDDRSGEIRVADLFGGCGGMTLGVSDACRALGLTFRPAAVFEIDQQALGVYCCNFGGPEPKRMSPAAPVEEPARSVDSSRAGPKGRNWTCGLRRRRSAMPRSLEPQQPDAAMGSEERALFPRRPVRETVHSELDLD